MVVAANILSSSGPEVERVPVAKMNKKLAGSCKRRGGAWVYAEIQRGRRSVSPLRPQLTDGALECANVAADGSHHSRVESAYGLTE